MNNTENSGISQMMIDASGTIQIISGEGEEGTVETYTGAKTVKAIRSRLTRERNGGDRWAILLLDGERV